jgi:hypothetical protein
MTIKEDKKNEHEQLLIIAFLMWMMAIVFLIIYWLHSLEPALLLSIVGFLSGTILLGIRGWFKRDEE